MTDVQHQHFMAYLSRHSTFSYRNFDSIAMAHSQAVAKQFVHRWTSAKSLLDLRTTEQDAAMRQMILLA